MVTRLPVPQARLLTTAARLSPVTRMQSGDIGTVSTAPLNGRTRAQGGLNWLAQDHMAKWVEDWQGTETPTPEPALLTPVPSCCLSACFWAQ